MPIHLTIDESGSIDCFFTFSRWRELKRLAEKKFKMPVDDLARAVLWQFVERHTKKGASGAERGQRLRPLTTPDHTRQDAPLCLGGR